MVGKVGDFRSAGASRGALAGGSKNIRDAPRPPRQQVKTSPATSEDTNGVSDGDLCAR